MSNKRIASQSGEAIYMLCGQYLTDERGGRAHWAHFATIKTSEYEHYLSSQASLYCQEGSTISGREGDLSALLQARFDSLSTEQTERP